MLTPRYGAAMKGEPETAEEERLAQAQASPHAARLCRREPRIVQICVQCIANLACDEIEDQGETTVDKIVNAGAVRARSGDVVSLLHSTHLVASLSFGCGYRCE